MIVSGNAAARDHILNLGADQYIDYKTTDYWEVLDQIDYVIDTRGGADIEREMAIMKPGGRIVSLIDGPNKQFAKQLQLLFWKQLLFSLAGRKWDHLAKKAGVEYRFIFVRSDGAQLKKSLKLLNNKRLYQPSIRINSI